MNRISATLLLVLVLGVPARAMKPMAWESLMRVKAAAEKGDPEAQFLIGLQCKAGDGIDRDPREAVKWLRKAAEAGHAEAQYVLGDFYAGLDPADELADPREAEKWLQAATEQGNADARARLAVLRARAAPEVRPPAAEATGQLVPTEVTEDPSTTVHWSVLLAALRGAEAFLVRGFLLENGIYVNRDVSAAADNYRQAAVRGDARGQLWFGLMRTEGRGVAKDPVEAIAWLKLAVANGSSAAPAALAQARAALSPEQAEAVARGAKPPSDTFGEEDPAEAAKWSALLSGLRGAEALLVRGFVLENGIHVTRDLSAAADNYRLAFARGDARGKFWLGLMQVEESDAARETAVSPAAKTGVEPVRPGQTVKKP